MGGATDCRLSAAQRGCLCQSAVLVLARALVRSALDMKGADFVETLVPDVLATLTLHSSSHR
jgi:hypothetical protein